ncbi:trypsin-like peptidase domain-containing protein [Butyrivibrio sp. INlla14]|uniref:trypsin-like peptidase domain-containing protein n=1 Tax=Butyrivibrio sp. INlla14 TaxID=1520808 RepID=UPI0008765854|nr:trypsin-like peptidase domain-containing protein [Butyrivibrio sp. INlla14]SCY47211.1 FHA domain-containing protein [Butyrivibrio sp. INlla14]
MRIRLKNTVAILMAAMMMNPLSVGATDIATDASSENASIIEDIDANTVSNTDISMSTGETSYGEEAPISLSTVTEARNGVLQVNCIYTDDLGNTAIIAGGSGFLIGSKDGSEYVITNNHIISPSKEYRDAAFKALNVPKDKESGWDKINLTAQVVVEGDVVLEASVVKASESMDMVVLELEQPIYTRTPLVILTSETKTSDKPYAVPESVYTLGYPTGITYETPAYYSNDKVSMTSGSIANTTTVDNIQLIQHDAKIDNSNCGGPLVNEYGFVLGMNELMTDGSNYYTLDASEITSILDGLGIEYSKITTSEFDQLVNPPELPDEPTPPVVITPPTIDWKKIIMIVGLCVLGLVAIGAIAFGIVLIVKKVKDNKEEEKKEEEAQKIGRFDAKPEQTSAVMQNPAVNNFAPGNPMGNAIGNGETTVLNAVTVDAGTTTLAGRAVSSEFLGTLIRKKNGDNIVVNKDNFSIGKDSMNIDFRITDNSAISRRHALIKKINGEVVIEDNSSTNGTFVNGIRLAKGQIRGLKNGDSIKLANEEFVYRK